MKKTLILTACLVLLLAAAVLLHAEGPGGFHRRMGFSHGDHGDMARHGEFMAKALDLNDEQKAAARKIHEEVMAKAKPLSEQRSEQWREIHEMLESGNADATAVGQRLIAAHATREQLKALHQEAMEKFRALLNADQIEKLETLHERHGRDRDHDHGGFELH